MFTLFLRASRQILASSSPIRSGALFVCALAGLFAWVPASAVTQGSVGTTSTGTVDISVTVRAAVRISGLQDISLNTTQNSTAVGQTPLCITSTQQTGYRLEAVGSGTQGEFNLAAGGVNLPYRVYFSDQSNRQSLLANTATTLNTADQTLACKNANNAHIQVEVAPSSQQTPPGTYTGTLTLVVVPN